MSWAAEGLKQPKEKKMKKLHSLTAIGFLLLAYLILFGGTSTARGEPFIDLYYARVIPQRSHVKEKSSAPFRLTIQDGKFDTYSNGGARIGWWFGGQPSEGDPVPVIGASIDVFHFKPDFDRQVRDSTLDGTPGNGVFEKIDIDVTVIGLNLMVRALLFTTPKAPQGQVQLYLGAGPAAFVTSFIDRGNFVPSDQRRLGVFPGLDTKTGLKLFITKNLAIFGEYRFTMHSPEVKFRDGGNRERLSTTFRTHHVGGGISLHFFVP